MTQQQFLEEIKLLSVVERIALLEAIIRSLREEMETNSDNVAISGEESPEARVQEERERKIAAVRRLRGVLKTPGRPRSEEELKDDYTNYLIEKYS